jgi:signal transduction protein with GAF and PtsI domain
MSEKKSKLKQVKVYFSESDFLELKEEATQKNISMAELVRQKMQTKIPNAPAPKKSKKSYRTTDPKLLFELNKIGNNLNQIAKKLNTKNELESKAIFEIYEKVMSLA